MGHRFYCKALYGVYQPCDYQFCWDKSPLHKDTGRLPAIALTGRPDCPHWLLYWMCSKVILATCSCICRPQEGLWLYWPPAAVLNMLYTQCHISANCILAIQWLYTDITGLVSDANSSFQATKGVKQGFPCSPLLFELFFYHIVDYITSQVPFCETQHWLFTVFATCLAI